MKIEINQITENDIEGYHKVLDIVARECLYISFLEAPPIEQTTAFVKQNILSDNTQIIAKDNEKIVGWCDVSPKQQPIYAHSAVLGMGVLPNYRGHGIGTALIDTALKKAFEKNIVRIELAVFTDNLYAIKLYKKFGFQIEGELQDEVMFDGQYKNSFIMALFRK